MGDVTGLPHSPRLGFHCRCIVRNQSLLAATATVTRGTDWTSGCRAGHVEGAHCETRAMGKIRM